MEKWEEAADRIGVAVSQFLRAAWVADVADEENEHAEQAAEEQDDPIRKNLETAVEEALKDFSSKERARLCLALSSAGHVGLRLWESPADSIVKDAEVLVREEAMTLLHEELTPVPANLLGLQNPELNGMSFA